jgi:copper chaperone CopZ
MPSKTLNVPNISCMHCACAIQKELTPMAGVSSVQVDVPGKHVTISYDTEATLKQVEAALTAIGYPVAQ